ncbi:MAG: malate synthase G, partial [SAR86 cluster bacterium]|nr:malate synthase G [SAR86 cluster bacterium]
MSDKYIAKGSLSVSTTLDEFLTSEVLPDLNITSDHFWQSLESIVQEFGPRNRELLGLRETIQQNIDDWHLSNKGQAHDSESYKSFLKEIGYLIEDKGEFTIETQNIDPEIAAIAGPQLVVPVMNARFALNAANARWGSLYDALYGTDMISEDDGATRAGAYNPVRGNKVIAFAKNFLDEHFPLSQGSYDDVLSFSLVDSSLSMGTVTGELISLKDATQFQGYQGLAENPSGILLKNNNLHAEIQIDPSHSVGATDKAGIKDVLLESAVTTIQDCEDSVAAVDGEDKVEVYRNWLGLMKGDLKETFIKGGSEMTRSLNLDREYLSPNGSQFSVPGRSLMLVRNVGHLMTNPAILDQDGLEIPEGILDAMFTICIAMHDLNGTGSIKNSRAGSIYIVKPKMHGPDEVQFTCDLFSAVEKALGIKHLTAKVGIMDEERRTT